MPTHKSFSTLRDNMSPQARARSALKADALRSEMDLAELRKARQLSQESLAAELQVSQGSVAKMEKRNDMYLSSLRRFVEALGGELKVTAEFADRSVTIKPFSASVEEEGAAQRDKHD